MKLQTLEAWHAGRAGQDVVPNNPDPQREERQVPTVDFRKTIHIESLHEMGEILARSIAEAASCRALLALFEPRGKRFRLIGDSRGLEKPRVLSIGESIEQALTESRIIASAADGTCRESTVEHETPPRVELARQLGAKAARVLLLVDASGSLQGAIVLLGDAQITQDTVERSFNDPLPTFASYLRLRRDADATWWSKLKSALSSSVRNKRSKCLLAGAIVLTAILAIPAPHRIGADCQCEPSTRRIVTSPFDGQLHACLVKPGDRVTAGQILATFEGSEIAGEIESLEAEQKQAQQRYDAALAGGDAVSAAQAALEAKRVGGRLKLLGEQQARLELRSPISGFVVSGDLSESVGATLAIGQPLIEVAPLKQMTAEISIEEENINLVSVGKQASLAFDGCPGKTYQAKVERIFPRAEVIDGENVYIAKATIEGDVEGLAPGMRGRAKVNSDWQPLGWILFRKPYYAVRRFWGWY